jgi:hypothetical protein
VLLERGSARVVVEDDDPAHLPTDDADVVAEVEASELLLRRFAAEVLMPLR